MQYGAGFSFPFEKSRFIVRQRPTPRHVYVRKDKLCLRLPAFSALQATVPLYTINDIGAVIPPDADSASTARGS